ncbi:hypothetical protein [Myxococcus sp. NMCA1]|uniref:hypothetical protein n=1 Tax=Myxococcus sp. NMCA1 TaxID=2996785 RepID=UPI0022854780|nr:hypothetical protein [Myxococcus sp. NMCA1]WAM28521.1 hypothetical protein OZ403_10570 [Myxococcus sp. NMCA1]
MTNTTPESESQSVSPLLQRAEVELRGQEFIRGEALPNGLRLTGRKSLLGRTAFLTEDDVRHAREQRAHRAHSDGLRDAAMWALIKAPEPRTAEARTESCPALQSLADHLRGPADFCAQAQGSGLALFAVGSSRTAYLSEMVANAAVRRGGIDELTRQARAALGLDGKAPIAHVSIEASIDTSQVHAAASELGAAVADLEEKLDSRAGQLAVLLAVIPAVSGAVASIPSVGTAEAEHEVAATHLVALVEKARKLALGAE